VMFGEITNEKNLAMKDMSGREIAVVAPLVVLAIAMGVYPKPFFEMMHASVETTIGRVPPAAIAAAGHKGDPSGIIRTKPAAGHGTQAAPAAGATHVAPAESHGGHDAHGEAE